MDTQQPSIYAALGVTLAFSSLALFLRLYARRITDQRLGYDDLICIAAYTFSICWTIIVVLWASHGLGLHRSSVDLTDSQLLYVSNIHQYFVELSYAFSLAFSKLAILAFYWRVFKLSGLKIPIIVLAGAAIVWLIIRTFLAIFHCVPVQAFWDKSIEGAVCMINDSKFFFGSVLAHLILDLAIMALPIFQIRHLQLRSSQKIGISAMFTFGIFVCIASVVVIVYSLSYDPATKDPTWDVAPIIIWATVEVNLAVISACLPLLRPIFMKTLRKLNINSSLKATEDVSGYQRSRPKSFMRLTTLKNKASATTERGETESTHQLADSDQGSFHHSDPHHSDHTTVNGPRGPQVTITGSKAMARDLERGGESSPGFGGIMVKSETSVKVSNLK